MGNKCSLSGDVSQSRHVSGSDVPAGKSIRETRMWRAKQNVPRTLIPAGDDGVKQPPQDTGGKEDGAEDFPPLGPPKVCWNSLLSEGSSCEPKILTIYLIHLRASLWWKKRDALMCYWRMLTWISLRIT